MHFSLRNIFGRRTELFTEVPKKAWQTDMVLYLQQAIKAREV